MTSATIFWLVLFGLSAVLFFVTAAIITVVGVRDLKDLLRKTEVTK
jgi:hypothetical protein